jgi:hypothetical protein
MHGGNGCNRIGHGARIASHFHSFSEGKLAVAATTRIKARNNFNLELSIKSLYVKSLQEGRNCGFDSSLRKLSIKSSLVCRVLEPHLKVR